MKSKIDPNEKKIVGKWVDINGQIIKDSTCKTVEYLVSEYLEKIDDSSTGWSVLYQDKSDGRYWELSYPQSEMQGGGPPTLTWMSIEDVKKKYSV
jgi:hypothetical protein